MCVCVGGAEGTCHGFPYKGNCRLLLERVYIWLGVGVNGNREGGEAEKSLLHEFIQQRFNRRAHLHHFSDN